MKDCEKNSALHIAAHFGHDEVANQLLLSGAKVNLKDGQWLTPLHRACRKDNEVRSKFVLIHLKCYIMMYTVHTSFTCFSTLAIRLQAA